ncbi:glutamate--tRNA ligase [Pseudomonadota bacterium]
MTVRTRFAPSPTGHLHIGGVRTALFSWLQARKEGGSFILRIEDTDRERSTQASVDAILEGMAWLGLDCDEGPIYQTERFDRYQEVIERLLEEEKAYRCYCSKAELDAMREQQRQRGDKPRYDRRCRENPNAAKAGVDPVIRFKSPLEGEIVFDDLIRGRVTISNNELDDLIIARGDGTPTYNFTVVVDDMDMQISHVIRGDDHINNTPRQINIFTGLGAKPPIYAHVPMILGADGSRLSKRHGAVSVLEYRNQGVLPEAMLNYLARLGWSHGDQEIFSLNGLVELFDINDVNKAASVFNLEKLLWLNQHYIKAGDTETRIKQFQHFLDDSGRNLSQGPATSLVFEAYRERAQTFVEMLEKTGYLYEEYDDFDEKAAKKNLHPQAVDGLIQLSEGFEGLKVWERQELHNVIEDVAERLSLKLGKVAQPLRVALTGTNVSPPIDITLEMVGKKRTIARIRRALDFIQSRTETTT